MFKKLKFWYYHFKFLIIQKCLYNVTVFKYAIDNIDHMEDSISKRILSLDFIQKIINKLYLKLVKKTIVTKTEKTVEKTIKKSIKDTIKKTIKQTIN